MYFGDYDHQKHNRFAYSLIHETIPGFAEAYTNIPTQILFVVHLTILILQLVLSLN